MFIVYDLSINLFALNCFTKIELSIMIRIVLKYLFHNDIFWLNGIVVDASHWPTYR